MESTFETKKGTDSSGTEGQGHKGTMLMNKHNHALLKI